MNIGSVDSLIESPSKPMESPVIPEFNQQSLYTLSVWVSGVFTNL
jgi:hypothetical protein